MPSTTNQYEPWDAKYREAKAAMDLLRPIGNPEQSFLLGCLMMTAPEQVLRAVRSLTDYQAYVTQQDAER